MHVSALGTEVKVESDFEAGSPLAAATQCAERIDSLMRGFAATDIKAITHG
jgi:hypothetical protein